MPSLKRILPLSVFLIAGWLTGCSTLSGSTPERYPEVTRLIDQQHFGAALKMIDTLSNATAPDRELQQLRNEAIYQAFRFEQQVIAEATTHQDEGDWRGVLSVMDRALDKYPESASLQDSRRAFRTEQEKQLANLDTDFMLARASWLLEQRELLLKKRSLGGDRANADASRLGQIDAELQRLHGPLIAQGRRALKAGKLALATRCIELAQQIETNQATKSLRAELDKKSRQRNSQAQARKRRAQQQKRAALARKSQAKFKAHLAQAKASLTRGELAAARDAAAAAALIDSDNPDLFSVTRKIQQQIAHRTDTLIAEGNSLYRRGEFHAAHERWAEAAQLDPDNTLAKSRLERAERVIEKLEKLRQQQNKP